jgi:hypothetical protein
MKQDHSLLGLAKGKMAADDHHEPAKVSLLTPPS